MKINSFDHHLVSYYLPSDDPSSSSYNPHSPSSSKNMASFEPITTRVDIMSLDLPPHVFNFKEFRIPPRVEVGLDGVRRIV